MCFVWFESVRFRSHKIGCRGLQCQKLPVAGGGGEGRENEMEMEKSLFSGMEYFERKCSKKVLKRVIRSVRVQKSEGR